MKQLFKAGVCLALCSLVAQPMLADKKEASPEKFMRNSIYTMLLVSQEQNKKLDEESQKEGVGTSLVKGLLNTDAKKEANTSSASEAPQLEFFNIAIPDQFNDHNLGMRLINFDAFAKNLTDADRSEVEAMIPGKKKSGFGKLMGAMGNMAAASVGIDTDNPNAAVDADGAAAIWSMIKNNHLADSIVAKWFNYNPTADQKWDLNLVMQRGEYAASAEDRESAKASGMASGLGQRIGMDLIPNTYILATNLRFRSNQAIVAEAEAVTGALATSFLGNTGALATAALGAAAGAAAGEGYQVQAQTYLFKLDFDENAMNTFAENIFAKNGTLQDLIDLGICKMTYLGKEKAGSRVRQSITNKTSQTDLIRRATNRALDAAIAKLQEKHEGFRTAFPISSCGEDGTVYAKVGMKEGISKGDEYEILEMNEDAKTGKTTWKKIGSVKAVDKKIWDNRAGAEEELALDSEEANADGKADAKNVKSDSSAEAVALGHTAFSGAKKGADFTGYYLRLKKKK